MAFSSANALNEYLSGSRQRIPFIKTATRTTVVNNPFSMFDIAGDPGAGTLAGTSTANGVVPTDATTGCPIINPFGSGNTGYLTRVECSSSAVSRIALYDMVFKAGAYAYNSGTTNLSSQPAISSRCPDYPGSGTVFGNGMEIWIEVSTAFTSATSWSVQVTYTNSDGTTGRTSIGLAAQAAAGLTIGKMFVISLAAGDSGVQKIESVIVTTGAAASGAFNVLIMRKLWEGRITQSNGMVVDNILQTGAPIVFADSAIVCVVTPDGTSSGTPNMNLEITNA
jgi:hypothetical protein